MDLTSAQHVILSELVFKPITDNYAGPDINDKYIPAIRQFILENRFIMNPGELDRLIQLNGTSWLHIYQTRMKQELAKLAGLLDQRIRPYQQQYIDAGINAIFTGAGRKCFLKSPTGSGKTFISMHIIKHLLESRRAQPSVIVFLSPRLDINDQCIDPKYLSVLSSSGLSDVYIPWIVTINSRTNPAREEAKLAKYKELGLNIIISGTYQSRSRLLTLLSQNNIQQIDLLICDEAHTISYDNPAMISPASSPVRDESAWETLLDNNDLVARRLFISATPYLDQERNVERYGPVIEMVKIGQLIRAGHLAKLEPYICKLRGIMTDGADETELVKTDKAKGIVDFMITKARQKVVVFVNSCDNGLALKDHLSKYIESRSTVPDLNIKISTYFGNDSPDILKRDFVSFQGPAIVITCKKINMGFDAPGIDGIVFADPRLSKADICQCIGRGLRLNGDKICMCLVFDDEGRNEMIVQFLDYLARECDIEITRKLTNGASDMPVTTTSNNPGELNTTSKFMTAGSGYDKYAGSLEIEIQLMERFMRTRTSAELPLIKTPAFIKLLREQNIANCTEYMAKRTQLSQLVTKYTLPSGENIAGELAGFRWQLVVDPDKTRYYASKPQVLLAIVLIDNKLQQDYLFKKLDYETYTVILQKGTPAYVYYNTLDKKIPPMLLDVFY